MHTHQSDWLHGFLAASDFHTLNGFFVVSAFHLLLAFSARRQTHAIAIVILFVCLSVRHTGDPRLKGSIHRTRNGGN